MKIKSTLSLIGILFLMATNLFSSVSSKYKIVNNSIVLKDPMYFFSIGVGANFLPDMKYQLEAKKVYSAYDRNNLIIPGYPRENLIANTSSSLKNKNKISFAPAIEVGIIDEDLYYSIKAALSTGEWSSNLLHEENSSEEYSLLGASIFVSLNYKFYSYKKLSFFVGPTAGVSLGTYKWNYFIIYEKKNKLIHPDDHEFVSKNGRYQNYLGGLNLGVEYRFNRSFAILLENSLLYSNMKNSDNRYSSEQENQSGGGYVTQEQIEDVDIGVNYQNNTSISLRYYF